MAGHRQHFLPRFLQKGFLGRAGKFWVFLKEKKEFETTPINIGLERDFYGPPGDGTLDETITEAEKIQSDCLDRLRMNSVDSAIFDESVPDLVTSLSVRSRWLRKQFAKHAGDLLTEIKNRLPTLLEKIIAKLRNHPKILELKKFGVSDPQIDEVLRNTVNSSELAQIMADFMKQQREEIEGSAGEAHNSALLKSITPAIRLEECKRLKWEIFVRPHGSFILADVPVIFNVGAMRYKALPEKGEGVNFVALPISDSHLLVGISENKKSLSLDEINTASAKCSFEFFIASDHGATEQSLASHIGEWSEIISKEELETIADECVNQSF